MLTLWDLIDPLLQHFAPPPKPRTKTKHDLVSKSSQSENSAVAVRKREKPPAHSSSVASPSSVPPVSASPAASMQARYDAVVQLMLDKHQIRVRKWRSGMSGVAWYVTYRDGRRVNLIEAPRPKGPMSAAVFLHEIGHHAIGFNVYKPRCLEEYHAWRWSLEAMQAHGLNITEQVRYRMHMSLWYAVSKAKRRGIKSIPEELHPFLERAKKPAKPRKAGA